MTIIPILALAFLISIFWYFIGIFLKNSMILIITNAIWWVGSLLSAVLVGYAWKDRIYSENWPMIGVIFICAPFSLATIAMNILQYFTIRKWPVRFSKPIQYSSFLLIAFLLIQAVVVLIIIISGRHSRSQLPNHAFQRTRSASASGSWTQCRSTISAAPAERER